MKREQPSKDIYHKIVLLFDNLTDFKIFEISSKKAKDAESLKGFLNSQLKKGKLEYVFYCKNKNVQKYLESQKQKVILAKVKNNVDDSKIPFKYLNSEKMYSVLTNKKNMNSKMDQSDLSRIKYFTDSNLTSDEMVESFEAYEEELNNRITDKFCF